MSVLKRRAELLEQLIASTAHVTPGHPRYEALARSCKEKVEFHSFLDTHPDVVNAEYAQLKERLEDNAQFDKVTALSILSTRLQNLNFVSSQLDFASRQLSFLLAASRNVLRTVADPEILAQAGINNTTVTGDKTSATHPSAWSDDEDDSDAEWWANEVAYSPEDGLSVWSWEDEEEQQEEGKLKSGSRGHDDGGSFLSLNRNGLGVDEATKPFIPDPTSSPLTPLTLSRAAVASPKRHSTRGRHQHHLSPLRRVKQPYSATSLAIWLAAKDSGGHPARQLDPRRCFTDSELVTQVINMLKGLQMPGLAFKFDSESDTYNVCRGVHTSDLPPGSIASLLTTFTALATHLRRIQTFCDAIVFTSTNYQDNKENPEDINALRALPTVGAFAAAVARQVVAIRGQLVDLETASTSQNKGNLNLLFLRLKLALMKRQVAALHAMVKECYWKGTAPCTASALLDSLSSVLETHLMRSGQHSGAVSAMLVEIFCAAWKPLNDALDIWLSNGSLAAAPPEFYIYYENNDSSGSSSCSTFWTEKYRLQRWTREHGNAVAAPSLLAPLAESLLQAGLASVGLTLSTGKHHLTRQTYNTETSPSLHTAFTQSLASIVERGASAPMSLSAVPRHETRDSSTREMNLERVSNGNDNSNANGNLEDGLWLKEWTAAVARSPATAMVPLSEDISDLSLFPKSALDLPEAFMCPETTFFIDGNSARVLSGKEGEGHRKMGPWKKKASSNDSNASGLLSTSTAG
ncbi:hypothetical protein KSW81_001047 [Nannochloris sp. 'desiccata']|nr:hypothetical protein KSW81_001047 [Chlorella desiccata (nom. nud.)]